MPRKTFLSASTNRIGVGPSESTPGAENIFDAPADNETISDLNSGSANISAAEKIYLNEILPHPKGDEKTGEFIEIVNQENGPVDLFGWTIRDGSKTGKYIFKEHVEIDSGAYIAIYRPESKLATQQFRRIRHLVQPAGRNHLECFLGQNSRRLFV